MATDRIVVYMGNRKYYPMLLTASKSLLYNTRIDRIYFLIEDDSFPAPLPDVYRTVNISDQHFFRIPGPNVSAYYTYVTLMRAALSKVFPQHDRVLLLDPDTIVTSSIDPLWDINLSGYYLAAVPETRNNNHKKIPYYNAGVMLMNLAKLRNDGMDDRIIDEINSTRYEHLEQDVINFLCDDKILPLPAEYNASHCTGPTATERIHHYVSYSKHLFQQNARQYKEMTFDYILSKGANRK